MKNILLSCLFILSLQSSFTQNSINWLSFEEALAKQKEEPRKMMIFVIYSECRDCGKEIEGTEGDIVLNGKVIGKTKPLKVSVGCSWCKVMKEKTLTDSAIIEQLNQHFYSVWLDISTEDTVRVNGHVLTPVIRKNPGKGLSRSHQLYQALSKYASSFPNTILLNEKLERIEESPGMVYKKKFIDLLEFAKEEKYKEMDFQSFQEARKSP
ncbi:MAG: hypothetical protein AAF696_07650 [Bacteroidota bacterium]